MPPSVALEVVSVLADRAMRVGPMRPQDLHVGHLEVGGDGRLRLPQAPSNATSEENAGCLRVLLFELVAGTPCPSEGPARARALADINRTLVMWPGGSDFSSFLQEIFAKDPPDLGYLRDRTSALRARVGGGTLRSWLASSIDSPLPTATDDFDSPDSITGSFPAGALAQHAGKPNRSAEPVLAGTDSRPNPAGRPGSATPVPQGQNSGFDALSRIPTWALGVATLALLLVAVGLLVFVAS
jgi:hypothetical protein